MDSPTAYPKRNAIKMTMRVSDAGRNKFALFLPDKYVDLEGLRLPPVSLALKIPCRNKSAE